ncbi:MAG: hypothetical protein U1A78_38580 [Polyangia bacterium]
MQPAMQPGATRGRARRGELADGAQNFGSYTATPAGTIGCIIGIVVGVLLRVSATATPAAAPPATTTPMTVQNHQ